MTEHSYPDPEADAGARAAQITVMAITVAEAIARVHQERVSQRIAEDERATHLEQAKRIAAHTAARVAWSPALNDRWLQRADLHTVLAAWAPAVGWATSDPGARDAAERTEQRLAAMFPLAMQRYAQALAEGNDAAVAMSEAAPAFAENSQPAPSAAARAISAPPIRVSTQAVSRRR